MARRRSYGKGKDPVLVFMNNCVAEGQKRRRAEEKNAAAASRRWARERERERAREAREAERAQVRLEKENEKKRKEQMKLDAKADAVAQRLKLEFEKLGLYAGEETISEISVQAVKASVTPAKAKSYFVDGKEDALAKSCAIEFLTKNNIAPEYRQFKEFPLLVKIVSNYRPQVDAEKDKKYDELKKTIDKKIAESIAKAKREDEREKLIVSLLKKKTMFKDELEEFAEVIDSHDWDHQQSIDSKDYKTRVKNKNDYVSKIKSQIAAFSL